MRVDNKRVFICDLPETATKEIIEEAFGEYGKVTTVEIKERKKVDDKYKSLFFAYVNLDIDDRTLQKCFKDFANGKWLEQCVMLQIARESFLDRLKREREENKTNSKVTTSESINEKTNCIVPTSENINKKISKVTTSESINNKTNDVSTETFEAKESRESNKVSRKKRISTETKQIKEQLDNEKDIEIPIDNSISENGTENAIEFDNLNYKIKNNNHTLIKDVLKIPSVGNKPIATVELHKKEVVNQSEANLKRLESLKNFKKGYQNQKSVIQAALSNIDGKQQNKIRFDETEIPSKKRKIEDEHFNESKQKTLLFNEESDEDDNVNFDLKEQFEGAQGQKLLELQSKYKNDKRFTLDSRFREDQPDVNMFENVAESNDMSIEDEKKKELEILSEVLGKKITMKSQTATKTENTKKSMLRFDPAQPEHSKYEIVSEGKKKEKTKTKKDADINEKKQEEKEVPNVSKELFYKVNENLKGTLEEDKGFSLLNMFGQVENDEPEQEDEGALKVNTARKNEEINPFRYESSDDEDETGDIPNQADMKTDYTATDIGYTDRNRSNLWTESFFFKPDDYRLQEGFEFIEKMKFEEKSDFSKLRRDLKEIVKAKVRNNQSKKKPFKRKLGGNKKRKMIRMKKALKK